MGFRFDHVGFLTPDTDYSFGVYRALGCELTERSYRRGIHDVVYGGAGTDVLLEFQGPPLPAESEEYLARQPWSIERVALVCSDVEAAYERLMAAGVASAWAPEPFVIDSVILAAAAGVWSPEGLMIDLVEHRNVAVPRPRRGPREELALHHVCCVTSDLARAEAFWVEHFGLVKTYDFTAPLEVREKSFKPRLSFHRPWSRGLIRTPVGAPRLAQPPPPVGAAERVPAADWAISHGYSVWTVAAGWARYDALTFRWLEANGYEPELLSQWDLDRDPAVLDGYRAVVTTGHDEYWTAAGRAVLDRFITEGGRYARLAGNIVWQVRMEDGLRTQVCHKYAAHADPERHSDDIDLHTGAFEGHYIDRPSVTTFGANGLRGVCSRMGGLSPRGAGGFIVYRPEHWAFAGADIYYADVLGGDIPLVGYETDGMDYTFRSGLPYPTGADGAPEGLEILALTPVTLEEQDHGQAGNLISIADGDLSFAAEAIHGEDTPENRNKLRYGSAVITSMPKGRGRGVLRGHDGVVPRPGPRRPPSGDHHRQRPGPLPRQLAVPERPPPLRRAEARRALLAAVPVASAVVAVVNTVYRRSAARRR